MKTSRIGRITAAILLFLTMAFGGLAEAQTRLWLQGDAGDYIDGGQTATYTSPDVGFHVQVATSNRFWVRIGNSLVDTWDLTLEAPPSGTLAVGPYEMAARAAFPGSSPGVEISGYGRGCNTITGRFVVLAISFDGSGTITSLAADFEQHCEAGSNALWGELRYNSSWPLSSERAAGWTTPDAFTFGGQTGVIPSTTAISNPTTIYGINAPASLAITGGEYSKNGGAFTSAPDTVANRDVIKVRATSSPTPGGTVTATLSVAGAVSGSFTLVNYTPGAIRTALRIQSDAGDYIGNGISATYTSPSANINASATTGNHFEANIASGTNAWTLDLQAPQSAVLGAGPYELAARYPFQGLSPGLDFSGNGAGCNEVAGRFVVLEAAFDGSGTISKLAADFEQHCEGQAPAMWGELRYNSSWPLSSERAAGWITPDPFTFGGQTDITPSTAVVSSPTTIFGINAPASITITGGEYSKNAGSFTSAPGTVVNKDVIRVRATSSPTAGATVTATVTVGGVVSGSFTLTNYISGEIQNALWIQSFSGDYIGDGQTLFLHAPDWNFSPTFGAGFSLDGFGPSGESLSLDLDGPLGAALASGAYENAARAAFPGASPGIDLSLDSRGCNTIFGRFAVLEYNAAQHKIAVDFEQWCDTSTQPLVGELRLNSSIPFNFRTPAGDSQPDPMAFLAQAPVKAGLIAYSNDTRIYGVNAQVPLSITGGEYSLNNGPFTSAPGFANDYDLVQVRLTASRTAGASRQAILNAGGTAATFSVTTYAAGTPVTGIYYSSTPGDYIGQGTTAAFLSPGNQVVSRSQFNNTVDIGVNGAGGEGWDAYFEAPNGAVLTPGVYENATRWPFEVAGAPGLDFSGDGRGCDNSYGRFVVYEATYSGGVATNFAADFEQHCETQNAPVLRGQIRYNSTVPFSFLLAPNRPQDLSGDGKDDLLWQHTDGSAAAWLMDGTSTLSSSGILGPGTGWAITQVGDFDGDGKSDLVWQHADGRMAIWLMNATAPAATQQLLNAGSGWHVTQVADLDGDGKSDLVFQNVDGSVAVWKMNGTSVAAGGSILGPGTGWSVAKTADFDGDGKADLLWTHTDGRAAIWLMNGTTVKSTTQILNAGSGWQPVQVGDFNGDGRADIVWQNADGRIALWLMNGGAMASGGDILGAGSGWSVAKVGDFDGDGKMDLLFQHTDGRAAVWTMDGLTATSTNQILNAGSGWSVAAVRDLDGDGRADILWRNADGRYAAWLMFGGTVASGAGILGPGTGWSLAP